MTLRRSLTAAISKIDGVDPEAVRSFVTQEKEIEEPNFIRNPNQNCSPQQNASLVAGASNEAEPAKATLRHTDKLAASLIDRTRTRIQPIGLIPVTVRLRPEIAGALKHAALERELGGADPFTQQAIVEAAIECWLRGIGYEL